MYWLTTPRKPTAAARALEGVWGVGGAGGRKRGLRTRSGQVGQEKEREGSGTRRTLLAAPPVPPSSPLFFVGDTVCQLLQFIAPGGVSNRPPTANHQRPPHQNNSPRLRRQRAGRHAARDNPRPRALARWGQVDGRAGGEKRHGGLRAVERGGEEEFVAACGVGKNAMQKEPPHTLPPPTHGGGERVGRLWSEASLSPHHTTPTCSPPPPRARTATPSRPARPPAAAPWPPPLPLARRWPC